MSSNDAYQGPGKTGMPREAEEDTIVIRSGKTDSGYTARPRQGAQIQEELAYDEEVVVLLPSDEMEIDHLPEAELLTDSLTSSFPGTESFGTESFGRGPLGTEALATDNFGTAPLRTDEIGHVGRLTEDLSGLAAAQFGDLAEGLPEIQDVEDITALIDVDEAGLEQPDERLEYTLQEVPGPRGGLSTLLKVAALLVMAGGLAFFSWQEFGTDVAKAPAPRVRVAPPVVSSDPAPAPGPDVPDGPGSSAPVNTVEPVATQAPVVPSPTPHVAAVPATLRVWLTETLDEHFRVPASQN